MLVKFFDVGNVKKHNTRGGDGAKNYLLSKDRIANGTAILVRGNADVTTEIINGISSQGQIYTAGCLAFDSHEWQQLTETQQHELMESFEQALFPSLDADQFSGYWVKHTDKIDPETKKPRLELNFVYANTELISGNSLTVYFTSIDKKRIDAWKDIQNYDYNLTDPNNPQLKQIFVVNPKQSLPTRILQQKVSEFLTQEIINGSIHNHTDVRQAIESLGLEIVSLKRDRNQINVKNPYEEGKSSIPLKGKIYEKDFQRESFIRSNNDSREQQQKEIAREREVRVATARTVFATELSKRHQRLEQRYAKVGGTKRNDNRAVSNYIARSDSTSSNSDTARPEQSINATISNPTNPCTADDFVPKNRTVKDDSKYTTTNFAKSESNTRNNRDNRTKTNTANRQLGQTATQQRGRSHKINLGDNVESNNSNDNSFIGSNDWIRFTNNENMYWIGNNTNDDNQSNNHALSAPSRGVLNDKQSNPRTNSLSFAIKMRNFIQQLGEKIHRPFERIHQQYQEFINFRQRSRSSTHQAESTVGSTKRFAEQSESRTIDLTRNINEAVCESAKSNSIIDSWGRKTGKINQSLESAIKRIELNQEKKRQQKILDDEKAKQLLKLELARKQRRQDLANKIQNARNELPFKQIINHYLTAKKAGIEFDYDEDKYSLYRAADAISRIKAYRQMGMLDEFDKSLSDYKNALIGNESNLRNSEITEMVREGTISFFGKLNHRHPYLIHYEHNKVEHHKIKLEGLNIAKQLNNQFKDILQNQSNNIDNNSPIFENHRALAKEIDEKIVAREKATLQSIANHSKADKKSVLTIK